MKKNLEWIRVVYINYYSQNQVYEKLGNAKFKEVITNIVRFMEVQSED